LGDGRSTLRRAAVKDVREDGAGDGGEFDAVMGIEVLIFQDDRGLLHAFRDVAQGDDGALFLAMKIIERWFPDRSIYLG